MTNDNTNQDTPSQRAQIRRYLEDGETLTSLQALQMFGCARLASRIGEIKSELAAKDQFRIVTEMIQVSPKKRVARYRIEKK